jgi:hypothetical protein
LLNLKFFSSSADKHCHIVVAVLFLIFVSNQNFIILSILSGLRNKQKKQHKIENAYYWMNTGLVGETKIYIFPC